jgi:hypothetical protein
VMGWITAPKHTSTTRTFLFEGIHNVVVVVVVVVMLGNIVFDLGDGLG